MLKYDPNYVPRAEYPTGMAPDGTPVHLDSIESHRLALALREWGQICDDRLWKQLRHLRRQIQFRGSE